MMGERTVMQEALFYSFRIEDHVPEDHLLRAIERFGHEGPAELGKVEALLSALDGMVTENTAARQTRFKRTLAGALVSLIDGRIRVEPAPRRRHRAD